MTRTALQGRIAEDMALKWLLERGFVLRERNWRWGHLEVDLIMEKDDLLHIVEVKSLKAPSQISPFEQVNHKKQRHLVVAARRYIFLHKLNKEVSFDIISIVFRGKSSSLEYIPNAFYPIM